MHIKINTSNTDIFESTAGRILSCKQRFLSRSLFQRANKPLRKTFRFPVVHVKHLSYASSLPFFATRKISAGE